MNHRLLKLSVAIFATILGLGSLYAQSCSTQYSGTTFQPKSGITDKYYNLDKIKLSDPSSEAVNTGYNFISTGNLTAGAYAVSTSGAQFQLKSGSRDECVFLSYSLSGLFKEIGKNQYKIKINFTIQKKNNCTATKDDHRAKVVFAHGNNYCKELVVENSDFSSTPKSCSFEYAFSSSTGKETFALSSDWSSDCALITVKSIEVIGCIDKKIVSENGSKVCAGEQNLFVAKGVSAPCSWEISTDNKTTWTPLAGTENSVLVTITDECYVRCTSGTTVLTSDVVRPVVCCSVAGTRVPMMSVDFVSTDGFDDGNYTRVNFDELDDSQSQGIRSTYTYKRSGNVDEGQYIITQNPINGGYWEKSAIIDNTHAIEGRDVTNNDGFLLVNCGKDAGTMFEYVIESGTLCSNTVYDFSAYIANLDPTASHEPVNAGFFVYGMEGETEKEQLLNTETGDLVYTGKWVEKGESFNSGNYKKFKLLIKNNHVSGESTVVGNDIGIDDIVFATCSPEVNIYTDSKYTTKDTVVCDDGKTVHLKLEAHAVYDLSTFFKVPYYLFQTSSDKKTWKTVGTSASTEPSIEIDIEKTTLYQTGLYYRVWVGGDKDAVEKSAKDGQSGTGCGMLTAASEPILIKYQCACSPTDMPIVKSYAACPDLTTPTLPLKSLVTSAYDHLRFYEEETGGADLGQDATFDAVTVGKSTYYVTNQKAVDPQTGIMYCESPRAEINIEIKDAAVVDPEDISLCFDDNTTDDELTFHTDNDQFSYKWTSLTGPSISSTEKNYKLDKKEASGTIKIEVSDPQSKVCPSTTTVSYNIKEKQKIELIAPVTICLTSPIATLTAKVSTGSGHYTWTKGSTTLDEGDFVLGQGGVYYTDNSVGTSTGKVDYKFSISNDLCSSSSSATVEIADKVTIPLLATSPVVDNRICYDASGSSFSVGASYVLGAGESLKWYINGVEDPTTTGIELANQNPSSTTKYDVELVNGPGGCQGDGTLTVIVDTPIVPTIEDVSSPICVGTSIDLIDSNTTTADKYIWYRKAQSSSTYMEMSGYTEKDILKYVPTETYTYQKESVSGSCKRKSNEVIVDVQPAIEFTVEPIEHQLCAGESVELKMSGYPDGATLRWVLKATNDTIAYDTPTKIVSPNESTVYTAYVKKVCTAQKDLNVAVFHAAAPDITVNGALTADICIGDKVSIVDSDNSVAEKYIWYRKTEGGFYSVMATQTGKDITQYAPTESATYKKESVNGVCKTESNEVIVTVHPAINFTITPEKATICKDLGTEVKFELKNYPATATIEWRDLSEDIVISTESTLSVTPNETTSYKASVTDYCTASKVASVTVLPDIAPKISPDAEICQGGSTILVASGTGVTSVTWTPVTGLSNPSASSTSAFPKTTTTYVATLSNGVCSKDAQVTVTVNPLPRFASITEFGGETCSERGIHVEGKNGTPPYYFSTDGENFYTDVDYYGIRSGYTKMYILDSKSCESDSILYLEPYVIRPDKYFTPNDDSNNALWNVANIDCYEGYIVEIFDRYGKRLYMYKKGSFSGGSVTDDFPGWDGIYNGHQMPSDDYWYLITLEEVRKQYNGHFILKR